MEHLLLGYLLWSPHSSSSTCLLLIERCADIVKLGPIIAGSMALHVGWRNFWWFNVGLTGVSLVLVIFLFPETKWHRIHPQEIREQSGTHSAMQEDGTVEVNSDKIMTSLKNTKQAEHGEEPRDQWLGRGRPSKQQWLFIQPNSNPWQALSESFSTPWKLFMFPIVEWAAFLSSWSCSSWLTLNLTQSQVFAAPPYNFSSQTVGKGPSVYNDYCHKGGEG